MTVARVAEIIAGSKKGFDHAIEKGVRRAQRTLRNVQGVWVKQMKIVCDDGEIEEYRVNLKITFVLEDNKDNKRDDENRDEDDDDDEERDDDSEPVTIR